MTQLRLDYNSGIIGSVPSELVGCDKLTLLSIPYTGISGNVTLCDVLGDNSEVHVADVSICGVECECRCVTT